MVYMANLPPDQWSNMATIIWWQSNTGITARLEIGKTIIEQVIVTVVTTAIVDKYKENKQQSHVVR